MCIIVEFYISKTYLKHLEFQLTAKCKCALIYLATETLNFDTAILTQGQLAFLWALKHISLSSSADGVYSAAMYIT